MPAFKHIAAQACAWAAAFCGLPALAQDLALSFPVDCALGESCFIQQYVDQDPGPGAQDFTCGPLSYDTHTGTDIRVADLAAMSAGVAVRAAAPGVVIATRDGEEDAYLTPARRAALEGKGCGNGVVVDHGNGWQTQYCHLRNGSIAVARGQEVAEGAYLGDIGLSGFTEFPHLELIVRKDGVVVDPFAPAPGACGQPQQTLWQATPAYQAGGFLSAGLLPRVPDFEEVKAGAAYVDGLSAQDDALVLWAFVFGARGGDDLVFRITDPFGAVFFEDRETLTDNQAQVYRAKGRRARQGLAPGTYRGGLSLERAGRLVDQQVVSITVAEQ